MKKGIYIENCAEKSLGNMAVNDCGDSVASQDIHISRICVKKNDGEGALLRILLIIFCVKTKPNKIKKN